MEEASSIFKAVENAWNRAGQPHDFSVKVFEEPQRNFFGMTVKSAKIALFFDEKSLAKTTSAKATQPSFAKATAGKPEKAELQPKGAPQEKPAISKKAAQPQKGVRPTHAKKESSFTKIVSQSSPASADKAPSSAPMANKQEKSVESGESIWTPEMVKAAEEWMRTSLSLMKMGHITFSTKLSKYYIHFSFDAKLLENNAKEKTLFRNFAYLIMASLRNKFKKEFRGLKVVLSS